MYGCIVVPPVSAGADFGVLFTHNEGFSTMCGHGIIGVATVVVEMGLAPRVEPETRLGIDTPAGFVEARVRVEDGRAVSVSFTNVPSFVAELDREVDVPGWGRVRCDVAFGGAFYAFVDAGDMGLALTPGETPRLIEAGRAVKDAVRASGEPVHPRDPDLGFLYGTIFVASAEVDRSPTGTGVSARLALHHTRGELEPGKEIRIESILGTSFTGRVLETTSLDGRAAVVPEVTGSAHITGRNELLFDPDDPLADGFLLR
jgi:trans-L-3-hydroxyproline dehydratase